ncbi:MAG: 2Fe-2S iron-sulfur cluster-binding protein [Bacteroidetes bacterium]|nr:2Fe-2S iron-sulfur cluster-binding protein [Bacteroidota bacterium]
MIFTIEINGQPVTAKRGETILAVLNRTGIRIPTLCHLAGFTPTGACRMCVVEVEGMPGLVTSCSHPVEEWMKITTHSPRVVKARRTVIELLLANHPDDCLYCERSGNCELQDLAFELNIKERHYRTRKASVRVDRNCPSIERDPAKCILCGRCIRVCNEIIGVSAIEIIGRGSRSMIGTSQNKGLNTQACVKCGQCIMVCPTAALREKNSYNAVIDALNNRGLFPVIQISPGVQGSIAEDIGIKGGKDLQVLLGTALRRMGFRQVFDTSASADVMIMEISKQLAQRIRDKEKMPLFTSCCPSWVKYIEEFKPGLKEHLVTSQSPMKIMGSWIKNQFAERMNIPKENIFSVAVMPCTSKKHEAISGSENGDPLIDAVLTTRELIRLIRHYGIDFSTLEPENTEFGFGVRGSAGKLSGIAGGETEAVARTLHFQLTGQEISPVKINDLRGLKHRKETRIKFGRNTYGFAAVSGLNNARLLVEEIENGRSDLVMVEVMACPFGCINGGGQRLGTDEKALKSRMKALYDADEEEMIKVAHKNPSITEFIQTNGKV